MGSPSGIQSEKQGAGCKAAPRSLGRHGDVFGASRKCLQRAQQLLAGEAWVAPHFPEAERGGSSSGRPSSNLNVCLGRARPETIACFAELKRARL